MELGEQMGLGGSDTLGSLLTASLLLNNGNGGLLGGGNHGRAHGHCYDDCVKDDIKQVINGTSSIKDSLCNHGMTALGNQNDILSKISNEGNRGSDIVTALSHKLDNALCNLSSGLKDLKYEGLANATTLATAIDKRIDSFERNVSETFCKVDNKLEDIKSTILISAKDCLHIAETTSLKDKIESLKEKNECIKQDGLLDAIKLLCIDKATSSNGNGNGNGNGK